MLGEKPKVRSRGIWLKNACKDLSNQTLALMRKNYLVFSRNLYVSILLLICPFLVCVYLSQVQMIVDEFTGKLEVRTPREIIISDIPKCMESNCITLGIGLTSGRSEWTDYAISYISKQSNLKIGQDIKILTEEDPLKFFEYAKLHRNSTQTGLILCSDFLELPGELPINKIKCDETHGNVYLMMYNFTIISKNIFDPNLPDPVESKVLAVKLAMDNAIINYQARRKGLPEMFIEAVIQSFPVPRNRYLKGYDAVSMAGPMYFFIPPMLIFGLLVSEIVKEKELRLRNGLTVIGVSATAFWLSWFIVAVMFSFITTNSLILSGYYFNFDVFTRTPYFLLFSLFFGYSITMMVLGFMLSTMITSVKLSYTISYSFLLCGLVLQNFFQSTLLMKLFHIVDLPDWVPWVRLVFSYYPPYNFSKIYSDIAFRSGTIPNYAEKVWEKGPGYFWSNFFENREGYVQGYFYSVPPSYLTMQDLAWNFVTFLVLTWYLDHVISGNRGRHSPPWFIFTREYWGYKLKVPAPLQIEMKNISENSVVGLKLEGICKQYANSTSFAVSPLNLTIDNDELVAIIGHNGAGKTTLLSMLTGLLAPSGGTAYISSYDLAYDLDKIHQIIGYCPQFNILWEELTAREHLSLFARLRNTPLELRPYLINQKLDEVNLTTAADNLVKTYSGGMKRRLSVAISSIGNPSIIFMDEPTTGMDPITRREVWKLIQDLKKGRVIILTTHSMEEAEILSDRVVVMVNGEIKCNGTCLYLKNHYGDGYKVELVSEDPQGLWEYLEKEIKSLRLIDISGGSLYVSIPKTEIKDVQMFFKIVEESKIQDWGLRNSSLEEVFMKVTGLLQNL